MATHPMSEQALADASTRLLDRTLGFIPWLDTRAQVLLGIDLGMLLSLALNAPHSLTPNWSLVPGAGAVLLLAASIWNIYRCAFPQLSGGANSLLYFQAIKQLREADFIDKFLAQCSTEHLKDLLGQVWRNSEIVSAKFNSLKLAMQLLAAAIPFWAIALTIFVLANRALTLK